MSSNVESRAALFAGKPQAVEVYQAGAWWSGELLGWRHAADGSCEVWVRVALDGVEETAWTDMGTLRLPERHLAGASAVASEAASAGSGDRELSIARHPSSRREHRADADSPVTVTTTVGPTASVPTSPGLPYVPDGMVAGTTGRRRAPDVPTPAHGGGRRRAPEESAPPTAGGRRRAPEPPAAAVAGRRRAPEQIGPTVGARRRAPEDSASGAGPAALLGRHGVGSPVGGPGNSGRHRTADTGLLPAVPDATASLGSMGRPAGPAAARRPAVLPSRPAEPTGTGGSAGNWSTPSGRESEALTRPMRLSDQLPHSRRPGLDRPRPEV